MYVLAEYYCSAAFARTATSLGSWMLDKANLRAGLLLSIEGVDGEAIRFALQWVRLHGPENIRTAIRKTCSH